MWNCSEVDLETQQNELDSYDIPTLSHLSNGSKPNLNNSQSTNDEGEVREKDCSSEHNKGYALRIWNSMRQFMLCLELNEVTYLTVEVTCLAFMMQALP